MRLNALNFRHFTPSGGAIEFLDDRVAELQALALAKRFKVRVRGGGGGGLDPSGMISGYPLPQNFWY